MRRTNQHDFYSFKLSGYKLLSVCLLIILVTISSCAVRKGLQYLFSGEAPSTTLSGKAVKASLATSPNVNVLNFFCEQVEKSKDALIPTFNAHSSGTSKVPLYFILIPAFLISVFSLYKDHTYLPVPCALLNWPQLPLFLQNRLLLI